LNVGCVMGAGASGEGGGLVVSGLPRLLASGMR